MSFYFSPSTRDRFKNFRKSFSESLSKTTNNANNHHFNNNKNSSSIKSTSVAATAASAGGNQSSSSGTSSSSSFTRSIGTSVNPLRSTILVGLKTSNATTTTLTTTKVIASLQETSLGNKGDERKTPRPQVIERAEVNNNNQHLRITMMPSVKSRLIKNISRTKEKILQGMGKTDRTEDENFDLYVENFDRQYAQANKLSKELHKYLSCMRETHKASRMFYETLKETYEAQWPQASAFSEQIDLMEVKWAEYLNQLYKDVQMPLMSYLNEFPELKKKIEKRCNRLLDYDNARHSLENAHSKSLKKGMAPFGNPATMTMNTSSNNNNNNSSSSSSSSSSQHNTSGGGGGGGGGLGTHQGMTSQQMAANAASNAAATATSTDQLTKLTKLKIDLEDKQHMYEEMNQTLCMALPVLFDNRVKFYSSLFQTFFHTETEFHSEAAESKSRLDEICESLSLLKSETLSPSSMMEKPNRLTTTNNGDYHHNHNDDGGDGAVNHHQHHHHHHDNNNIHASSLSDAAISEDDTQQSSQRFSSSSHTNNNHLNNNHHPHHHHSSNNHHYNHNNNSISNNHHHHLNGEDNNGTTTVSEFAPKTTLNDNYSSSNEDLHARNGQDELTIENGGGPIRISAATYGGGGVGLMNEGQQQQQLTSATTTTTTTTTVHKDRVMYRVRATFPYEAKELDELTFTREDLIMVVEGTESEKEDLDEGWLIGIHEVTNKRGLFPENFTKRIL